MTFCEVLGGNQWSKLFYDLTSKKAIGCMKKSMKNSRLKKRFMKFMTFLFDMVSLAPIPSEVCLKIFSLWALFWDFPGKTSAYVDRFSLEATYILLNYNRSWYDTIFVPSSANLCIHGSRVGLGLGHIFCHLVFWHTLLTIVRVLVCDWVAERAWNFNNMIKVFCFIPALAITAVCWFPFQNYFFFSLSFYLWFIFSFHFLFKCKCYYSWLFICLVCIKNQ